jgi:hypothetical protein
VPKGALFPLMEHSMFLYNRLYMSGVARKAPIQGPSYKMIVPDMLIVGKVQKPVQLMDPFYILKDNLKKILRNNQFHLEELWKIYSSPNSQKEREAISAAMFAFCWSEKLSIDKQYFFYQLEHFPDMVLCGMSGEKKCDETQKFEITTVPIIPFIIEQSVTHRIIDAVKKKNVKGYKFSEPVGLLIDIQKPSSREQRMEAYRILDTQHEFDYFQDIWFMSYSREGNEILINIDKVNQKSKIVNTYIIPFIKTFEKVKKLLKEVQVIYHK